VEKPFFIARGSLQVKALGLGLLVSMFFMLLIRCSIGAEPKFFLRIA
jgi:hypothetical protein